MSLGRPVRSTQARANGTVDGARLIPFTALHSRVASRSWPLLVSVATVATGMAYSLLWAPIVRHQSAWVTPGDIWAMFRGAHYVAWGDLGDVYGAHIGLVAFPGWLIVLAPVSMVASALGLSEGFPLGIAHPTAWLLLGPVSLLMVAIPLSGLDALAQLRQVPLVRRRVLTVAAASVMWSMVGIWGHPEDAVALGLSIYAICRVQLGNWRAAGWLMGVAVCVQPLSGLVLPAMWALAPVRCKVGMMIRSVVPAAFLLAILMSADSSDTWSAITRQPNYPRIDHPTPWVWLAPSLGHGSVAAGPGRLLAIAASVGIGVHVWRSRSRGEAVDLVSAASLAFAARCVFEPVMVPYYMAPALVFAILLASNKSRSALASTVGSACCLTAVVETHAGPVRWWLETVGLLVGLHLAARWRRHPCEIPRSAEVPEARRHRFSVV